MPKELRCLKDKRIHYANRQRNCSRPIARCENMKIWAPKVFTQCRGTRGARGDLSSREIFHAFYFVWLDAMFASVRRAITKRERLYTSYKFCIGINFLAGSNNHPKLRPLDIIPSVFQVAFIEI